MSQFFQIHQDNPQARLVKQAADILRKGGLAVLPTNCAYVLACHMGDKQAIERLRAIRKLGPKHNFTLLCRDLTELSTYAKVDNSTYRMIKNNTPGPYTFILEASRETPRKFMHPKKKTIGIRVPNNPIAQAILDELGEPLITTSLIMPGDDMPLSDPYDIRDTLQNSIDLVIDGGYCGLEATTVIDLTEDEPVIVRPGMGDTSPFE